MKLYPYQKTCVDFHLAHQYSMNCCPMGLGKTFIALAAAKETGLPVLVFGPAFLRGVWEKEADALSVPIRYVHYSQAYKVSMDEASKYGFWICDESHMLATPTTQRTHVIYKLLKACLPQYFLGLSGTPIRNRPQNIWTMLAFCGLNPKGTSGRVLTGDMAKYYRFSEYFCESERIKIRGRVIVKFGGIREARLEEFKTYLKDKMIKFKVEDVLKDLPAMTYIEVPIDVGPTPGLEEAFNTYMAGGKSDITAKATSAFLKAPHTVEYCENLIENDSGPLVIFSDHVKSAAEIHRGIPKSLYVTGQIPVEDRMEMVEEFQAGGVPAIVATIGSLSVGVTLTAANHIVFNDLSWVPADNSQAEKRIHRIGSTKPCFTHYIDGSPTDRHIRGILKTKQETIERVMG